MGIYRKCFEQENLEKAMKIVLGNEGSKTGGPDNITRYSKDKISPEVCMREIKRRLRRQIKCNARMVKIPKDNGKTREITICNLYDRMAQAAVYEVIRNTLEENMSVNSYGFRKGISAKVPVSKVAMKICEKREIFTIEIDFEKCFDKIPLDKALDSLRDMGVTDGKLLRTIKHLMYTDREYSGIGLSQGTILGPILANCYLTKLDKFVEGEFRVCEGRRKCNNDLFYPQHKSEWIEWCLHGRRKNKGISIDYYRYADDTLILCSYKEEVNYVYNRIKEWIELNLDININKSKTMFRRNETTFLGYSIKKDKITRKAWLRMKDPKRYLKTLHKIRFVNEKEMQFFVKWLRGILRYYDIANDIAYFLKRIAWKLYIRSLGKHGLVKTKGEDTYRYGDITINPWKMRAATKCSFKDYLVNSSWIRKREFLSELFKNAWNEHLYELWTVQKGKDYVTGKELKLEDLRIHHIIPRSLGGSDKFENLILVSKTTHDLIHNEKESSNPKIKRLRDIIKRYQNN